MTQLSGLLLYCQTKSNSNISEAPRIQGGASQNLAQEGDCIPFLAPTLLAFIPVHRIEYSADLHKIN